MGWHDTISVMDTPLLTVNSLKVGIESTEVLNDLSFEVGEGETVVVIGSNGAGKSLLIKTLMGLIPHRGGSFAWSRKVRFGYVPQKFLLPRHVPMNGVEFLSLKPGATHNEITRVLGLVEIDPSVSRQSIQTLSGGQFQRILIAWALLGKPDVVIFDEPTESVDVRGQESIYALIHDLAKKEGMTTFLITHDLDIVEKYASRVICLSRGKLVCSSNPKMLSEHILKEVYGTGDHHH